MMFSVRHLVLVSTILALSALEGASALAAPAVCSAADVGKNFCLDCLTKAKCEVEGDAPVESASGCTGLNEACTVLAGFAVCRPISETACACEKSAQCDAYHPDTVLVCLSGGVTLTTKCEPDYTCISGSCEIKPTEAPTPSLDDICKDADDGFHTIMPQCSSAVYCLGGTSIGSTICNSGDYFDVAETTCFPAPPVPCAGCGTGACPDKTDCSKFLICSDGMVLDEEVCDEALPDFDIVTNQCVVSGAGTCTANAGCEFSSLVSTTVTYTDTPQMTPGSDGPEWCSTSPPLRCTCDCDL